MCDKYIFRTLDFPSLGFKRSHLTLAVRDLHIGVVDTFVVLLSLADQLDRPPSMTFQQTDLVVSLRIGILLYELLIFSLSQS